MKPDLKSMNRRELEKLKADVEKALEKLAEKDKKAAIAAAEKAAAAHGFSLAEITGEGSIIPRKAKTGPKNRPCRNTATLRTPTRHGQAKGASPIGSRLLSSLARRLTAWKSDKIAECGRNLHSALHLFAQSA